MFLELSSNLIRPNGFPFSRFLAQILAMITRDKCKCHSRAMELSTAQVDWSRARGARSTGIQLYVVIRPRSHSVYDGDPLCPQGPYARQDTHACFEAASAPYHVVHSFSLPLPLISPRAFSHEGSFRLVLSPRGEPASDALNASGSWAQLVPDSEKPS